MVYYKWDIASKVMKKFTLGFKYMIITSNGDICVKIKLYQSEC